MPSPNGFDYFRRASPFRNARDTRGFSLDYFRRGVPLAAIASENPAVPVTITASALSSSGGISSVTLSLGASYSTSAINGSGILPTASLSLGASYSTSAINGSGVCPEAGVSSGSTCPGDPINGSGVISTATVNTGATSFRKAVRARLLADSDLVELIGSRVYFGQPSQRAVYPAVAVSISSRSYGHTLDGPDGTSVADVEITAYAEEEADAEEIGDLIFAAIDGSTGVTWSGIPIDYCLNQGDGDEDSDPIWAGDDRWIYQLRSTYSIGHRVPIPS